MTAAPRPWRSRFAWLHPKAYLGLHSALGVLACIIMVWAFAYIADEIPEQSVLVRVDDSVIAWLQRHGTEAGEAIFHAVSWLGAPVIAACVIIATLTFAFRGDWLRAIALALATLGGTALNNLLKAIFHRGRPEFANEFIVHQSWSFPSGHAMGSMVCYGFLAYLLLERVHRRGVRVAIRAAATILIVAIGYSRVYLGVHYPSDVLGGYLAGATWLIVCITGYRFAAGHILPTRESATAPTMLG